ncbi:MAG: winged helix-turn-helix domain-containing protein [Candidatus Omnitrophota bacterium]|nr:winged helix-turn-helix domain-containing protein [Candidatus Omnitrophota bacterium]
MITRIGLIAGDIWSYLEGHKKMARMDDVISELEKDRDLVLMSIGWLAREGHIILEGDSPNYTLKLKNSGGN